MGCISTKSKKINATMLQRTPSLIQDFNSNPRAMQRRYQINIVEVEDLSRYSIYE